MQSDGHPIQCAHLSQSTWISGSLPAWWSRRHSTTCSRCWSGKWHATDQSIHVTAYRCSPSAGLLHPASSRYTLEQPPAVSGESDLDYYDASSVPSMIIEKSKSKGYDMKKCI